MAYSVTGEHFFYTRAPNFPYPLIHVKETLT